LDLKDRYKYRRYSIFAPLKHAAHLLFLGAFVVKEHGARSKEQGDALSLPK
jgi:hypothetical protein